MKKTLITGGAGFLGSHLCEKLLEYKAKQRKPDITLAKEELDWEPKIKLEDGLVKTIRYFEGLLSSELLSFKQRSMCKKYHQIRSFLRIC